MRTPPVQLGCREGEAAGRRAGHGRAVRGPLALSPVLRPPRDRGDEAQQGLTRGAAHIFSRAGDHESRTDVGVPYESLGLSIRQEMRIHRGSNGLTHYEDVPAFALLGCMMGLCLVLQSLGHPSMRLPITSWG